MRRWCWGWGEKEKRQEFWWKSETENHLLKNNISRFSSRFFQSLSLSLCNIISLLLISSSSDVMCCSLFIFYCLTIFHFGIRCIACGVSCERMSDKFYTLQIKNGGKGLWESHDDHESLRNTHNIRMMMMNERRKSDMSQRCKRNERNDTYNRKKMMKKKNVHEK